MKEHGRLSSALITKIPNGHAPFMYRKYFGSLENAYALVGFHRYNQDNEKYAKFAKTYHLNRIWLKELKDNLRHAGFHVTLFKQSGLIINRCLVVTVRWGHPSGRAAPAGPAAWDGWCRGRWR